MNLAHKIHFFVNRELSEVYVSYAMRAFAFSMIGLFIPIFLLNMNYSLKEVLLFYFFVELLGIPFIFLSAKLAEKIGFKHTILLSVPVQILFFFLLFALGKNHIPLWFIGLIYGISSMLFWMPFHFEFAKNSDKKKRGFEFGMLETFSLLVVVAGPILGAVMIEKFSFNALFVMVSLLLFLSTFPLFLSKDKKQPFNINFKKFFFKYTKDADIFFHEGIADYAYVIIWPIFIYFMLGGIMNLGIIGSIGCFFTAFVPAIIGNLSDKFSREKMLKIGAFIAAPVDVFRGFFSSFSWILVWTALSSFAVAFFHTPFIAVFYDKTAKHKYEEYVAFREIYVRLGRCALLVLLIILLAIEIYWQYVFIIAFILAAASTLVCSRYSEVKS